MLQRACYRKCLLDPDTGGKVLWWIYCRGPVMLIAFWSQTLVIKTSGGHVVVGLL